MLKKYVVAAFLSAAIVGGAGVASAAETYQIDPAHDDVYFMINHFGWSNVMGRFNDVAGTIVIDEANPDASSVEVVIQASSVDTDHEARDNHLRSPDFFNTEEFPTITFKSTKIEKTGENTGVMTGDLTIIGATKSVSFPFTWNRPSPSPFNESEIHTGISAQLKIMRSEWGMTKFIPGLGDEATLFLEVEAIKQ